MRPLSVADDKIVLDSVTGWVNSLSFLTGTWYGAGVCFVSAAGSAAHDWHSDQTAGHKVFGVLTKDGEPSVFSIRGGGVEITIQRRSGCWTFVPNALLSRLPDVGEEDPHDGLGLQHAVLNNEQGRITWQVILKPVLKPGAAAAASAGGAGLSARAAAKVRQPLLLKEMPVLVTCPMSKEEFWALTGLAVFRAGVRVNGLSPAALAAALENLKKATAASAALPRTEDQLNQARAALSLARAAAAATPLSAEKRAALALGSAAAAAKARGSGPWAQLKQCVHKDCKKDMSNVMVTVVRPKRKAVRFSYGCPHCDKTRNVTQTHHAALYNLLEAWANKRPDWTSKQSGETSVITIHEGAGGGSTADASISTTGAEGEKEGEK